MKEETSKESSCFALTSIDLLDGGGVETRSEKLAKLRSAVKRSRWTYADIARSTDKNKNTIGDVLRGNYPHYGANKLPKYLRVWLENHGFQVDDSLITW